jgi:orotate phosphoribosyltransferase
LDLIYHQAFRYSREPSFKLTSGRMSRYYVDMKKVTLDPKGANLIGQLLFDRIKDLPVQGIGGLTLGADPIVTAVAMVSYQRGKPIRAFIVRKEPKGHGSQQWIEGSLPDRAKVVVVDDVITTGGSTLKAVERVKSEGHEIVKILGIVDRKEGGREAIRQAGYELDALYTLDDLSDLSTKGGTYRKTVPEPQL